MMPAKYQCIKPTWIFCAVALLATQGAWSDASKSERVPLGLPMLQTQPAGPSAAARVDLGRRLFMDKRLSADGTISCSSCHNPEHAFADEHARAVGQQGLIGTRNAPSLFNVVYATSLFWDGRRATLESQAQDPLLNRSEHGLMDVQSAVNLVTMDPTYLRDFASNYKSSKDEIDITQISDVLASYERTLLAGDSPFDQYFYGGKKGALSSSAIRGFELFRGRAHCAACHVIGAQSALFTDGEFHASTTSLPKSVTEHLPQLTKTVLELRAKTGGNEIDQAVTEMPDIAALGRFTVSLNPADIGKFKTPSLRNVALTAPYMHDGSLTTLDQVIDVELYVRGAATNYPIVVTAEERDDLLAFLRALTSPDSAH
jgi:cytochrome c peroxidase